MIWEVWQCQRERALVRFWLLRLILVVCSSNGGEDFSVPAYFSRSDFITSQFFSLYSILYRSLIPTLPPPPPPPPLLRLFPAIVLRVLFVVSNFFRQSVGSASQCRDLVSLSVISSKCLPTAHLHHFREHHLRPSRVKPIMHFGLCPW